jgi:hypothetical protein
MPLSPFTIDSNRLKNVRNQYKDFRTAPITYATVRDFANGVDYLLELATVSKDLKDAQRPWMMKSILGMVPQGGRLLEIGAGDPHVVHWLSQMGYQIVVVDPYDGSGHGPTDFEYYREHFPDVKFIRENFSDNVSGLDEQSFDCIYSISVLEHIPHPALEHVMTGIRRYQKPGAITIHAVDHVLKGRGCEHHRQSLSVIADGLGISDEDVECTLKQAEQDPDTYFLSAESHNMWRGGIPYDDFPMRRCVSVQYSQHS